MICVVDWAKGPARLAVLCSCKYGIMAVVAKVCSGWLRLSVCLWRNELVGGKHNLQRNHFGSRYCYTRAYRGLVLL